MDLVLILGLGMTAVTLVFAGRRVLFLGRLITSGQPAPDRLENVTQPRRPGAQDPGRRGLRPEEAAQVVGARRRALLRVLGVPDPRHGLPRGVRRPVRPRSSRSRSSGHWAILGFAQDLIAVLAVVSLVVFAQIRLKNSPERLGRQSRFKGSHLGGAWLVLFMIFNVIWTMFLFRGAASAAGNLPYDNGAFVSIGIGNLLDGLGHDTLETLEHVGLLMHIGIMLVFLILVLNSKHLHIFLAPLNVLFKRKPDRARRGQAADVRRQGGHPRRHRRPRRGRQARRRRRRGLLLEGPPRLLDLHRVRSLPVAVPGVEHREAAVPQAADHGAARRVVRQGAVHPGPGGQARGAARGQRHPDQGGRAPAGRRDRRRLVLHARGRLRRHRPRRPLVVRHLRCVRRAVPGRHRARRPHRRHASLPGAGRVQLPGRAQPAVQGHGEQGQPLEHVGHGPHGLGQGPRLRGQGRRRRHRVARRGRVAVLGRLRRRLRGPRQEDHPRGRRAARHGRRDASASSATARPAPATRPAAPATSSSSRGSPSRTPRPSRSTRSRRSSRPAPTASTRSRTSTRSSASSSRSCTTRSC